MSTFICPSIDSSLLFSSVCEYYAHEDCKDFAVNDCRETATYAPGRDNVRTPRLRLKEGQIITNARFQSTTAVRHHHHWREGNLPTNSKCVKCRKTCWSSECLAGMRCEWCGITVRLRVRLFVHRHYPSLLSRHTVLVVPVSSKNVFSAH